MQIIEIGEENVEDCRNVRHVAKNVWVGKMLSGNVSSDTIIENRGKILKIKSLLRMENKMLKIVEIIENGKKCWIK